MNTLDLLRDYISEAMDDPNISAKDVYNVIVDQLKDLSEYHHTQYKKAEDTAEMLAGDSITDNIPYNPYNVDGNINMYTAWDDLYYGSKLLNNPSYVYSSGGQDSIVFS